MKLMSPELYRRYSEILRTLRARRETLGLLQMQAAADLAIAEAEGDEALASDLRERLRLPEPSEETVP